MFHYQPHKTFISFFIKTMNYKSHQEFSPLNSMNSIGRSLNTHQDLMRTTSSNTRALNCWSHWIPAPTRSFPSFHRMIRTERDLRNFLTGHSSFTLGNVPNLHPIKDAINQFSNFSIENQLYTRNTKREKSSANSLEKSSKEDSRLEHGVCCDTDFFRSQSTEFYLLDPGNF